MICHPDRSKAEWRDLLSSGAAPQPKESRSCDSALRANLARKRHDREPRPEYNRAMRTLTMRAGLYVSVLLATSFVMAQCQTSVVKPTYRPNKRELPQDTLSASVLIQTEQGSGTGFFLNVGSIAYLVTARHVLFKDTSALPFHAEPLAKVLTITSYSKFPEDTAANVLRVDLEQALAAGTALAHPTADVAIIKLGTLTDYTVQEQAELKVKQFAKHLVMQPGIQKIQGAQHGLVGFQIEDAKVLKYVLVGNHVYITGFPSSIGLQSSPQIDYTKPLLRKGTLSGVNLKQKSLVLDCQVFFGNSGGPVVEIEHLGDRTDIMLIGVISQYIPFQNLAGSQTLGVQLLTNSGYSIAVPMDFVIELISGKFAKT